MKGPPQSVYFLEKDLAKGQSTGLHIHHGIEMNVVLQGTLSVTVGDKAPVIMHRGDSMQIPREVPHVATNIGRDTVRMIVTYVVDTGRPLKEPWPPQNPPQNPPPKP